MSSYMKRGEFLNYVALQQACKDIYIPKNFARNFFIKRQRTGAIVKSPTSLDEAINLRIVRTKSKGRRTLLNLWDCILYCNIY